MPPSPLRSSIDYNAVRKQIPGLAASAAVEELSDADREGIENLRDDIANTMSLRGTEAEARILPPGRLRDRIRDLGNLPNQAQRVGGGVGALGGGILGAGVGACVRRL